MTKPKIIILINSLRSGGAERVVSHLLKHMKDEFEIHLALFHKVIDYEIPEEIKIFDLGQSEKLNPVSVFLKIPLLSYRLYKYCREHRIHTSISFLNRPCYVNALMRSLWGYDGKIVMCERTHQSTLLLNNGRLYSSISRALLKFSYKRASLVLTNSYSSKADLIENFHIKTPIQVIHNPIDLHFIQEQAQEPVSGIFQRGFFHFIYVGGFRKEKNLTLLLQALYIVKNLQVRLIIVGGGEQEDMLLHMVTELGLQMNVLFCGFDKNPYKYINRGDCFVLSSYVEGFPNVLLEALACGKSVISTDCKSGPREILSPASDLNHEAFSNYEIVEYGILTPVNDVTNLAAAMRKIYEDENLRTSFEQKAISRAEHFDVEEIKQYFHVAFSA